MLTDDMKLPPEVVEAGARALCKDARLFWPDLTQEEHDVMRGEARAAIIAMINAWPGMEVEDLSRWVTDGMDLPYVVEYPAIILPLPQENSDAE